MGFSVNTNSSSLAALQTLNSTTRQLNEAQVRINSGYKVNTAKDNASTFAIAQGMRGDIAGLKSTQESLSLGGSTVNVALTAATQISDILNQMKDKVIQGQVPNVDRGKIQADIDSFKQEITDIANAAQFNGVNLMKVDQPSALQVTSSLNRTAASGAGSLATMTIDVDAQDVTSTGLGLSGVSITGNNSTTGTPSPDLVIGNGNTITLTRQTVDATGAKHTITDVFEFTDGSVPLTSMPSSSTFTNATTGATDVAEVNVHAVLYQSAPVPDTLSQTLGKLYDEMKKTGYSVSVNTDGSFTVSAPGELLDATGVAGYTAEAGAAPLIPASGSLFGVGTVDLSAPGADPSAQLDTIEAGINQINNFLASMGVAANRLEIQGDFIKALTDTLTEGVGTLVDADLAEESATLQALQTKQQLGIQALSIANSQSSTVLSLFRNG
jgi:flagellin